MIHIENQFREGMSWDNYSFGNWEMDHIRPLCTFNLKNEKEVKKALHFTNMRPLWRRENIDWRKGVENYG